MNSQKANVNIITLGRSGVGKSSLLNYLLGKEHFKTGVGRPVTGAGFFDTQHHIAGIPVTIIDSYGIESGANFSEWKSLLLNKLKEHDYSHSLEEWLHVVIYCISAEDARVEPIDLQIIKNFISTGQKIIIVITHADEDEESCQALRDEISKQIPEFDEKYFVEIDSVRYKKQYFGKDLRNVIFEQYLDNVFFALPKHCIQLAKDKIDEFYDDMEYEISYNRDYGFLDSDSEHQEWLKEECKDFHKDFIKTTIPSIVRNSLKESMALARNLGAILATEISDCQDVKQLGIRNNFKNSSYSYWNLNLFNDSDSLIDKIGLSTLAVIFSPLLIGAAIVDFISDCFTHDALKKALTESAKKYCDNLKKQIGKKLEKKLEDIFSEIKNNILASLDKQADSEEYSDGKN